MIHVFFSLYRRLGQTLRRRWAAVVVFFVSLFAYSTTGFMYFELQHNPDLQWTDAAWWAIVTMTTVGYGDYFPATTPGRLLVGVPTMLLGVSMLGYMLSLLASGILEAKLKEVRGMAPIRFTGHIIICHYNDLDSTVDLLDEIRRDPSTAEAPIVLIDEELGEIPEELHERGVCFVRGNPARAKVLQQANLEGADCLLLQAVMHDPEHSDHLNLAIALTVERLHPEVHTVVHCVHADNAVFFERANVDSVVCLSALSSQMMIQELQDPGVNSIVSELTSNLHGKQFYLSTPPPGTSSAGELRDHLRPALLIGLRRGTQNILLPDDHEAVLATDQAIVIAAERPG